MGASKLQDMFMVGQLVIFWVCNGRLPRPHKLASVIAEEDLRAATEWSILAAMKMHAVSPI